MAALESKFVAALHQKPGLMGRIAGMSADEQNGSGRVVLNNLSDQIRDCLQHAEGCARKAAAQTDPALRDDFLRLEKRWLELARSMDFAERLNSFTNNMPKPNIKPNGIGT